MHTCTPRPTDIHKRTRRGTSHSHTHSHAGTLIHTRMHICTQAREHTLTHTHAHTRTRALPQVHTHTLTHTLAQTNSCTHIATQSHMCTLSYVHTHTAPPDLSTPLRTDSLLPQNRCLGSPSVSQHPAPHCPDCPGCNLAKRKSASLVTQEAVGCPVVMVMAPAPVNSLSSLPPGWLMVPPSGAAPGYLVLALNPFWELHASHLKGRGSRKLGNRKSGTLSPLPSCPSLACDLSSLPSP
jgi:hypothetical protein